MLSYIIAARWSNLGDLKTVKQKINKLKRPLLSQYMYYGDGFSSIKNSSKIRLR